MKRFSSSVAVGLAGALLNGPVIAATKVDVAEELERLAAAHGFEIKPEYVDKTRDHQGRAEPEDLMPRLRELLVNFDHIILQKPGGGVERVIILGETVQHTPSATTGAAPDAAKAGADGEDKGEDGDIVLTTQRKGTQHLIQVSLEGADGAKVSHQLLVDTGADQIVLPASMAASLKIPEDTLKPAQSQTANGKVESRMGLLDGIWLGEHRIAGVTVAFIDDEKLGGNALLGMSVLGRYRVTLDDEKNTLTLSKK